MGFPGGSDGKESACNAGDPGLIPGLGGFPGEGNGQPLQYSCLGNPMDRGARWATVPEVPKSRTRLSDWHGHISLLFVLISQRPSNLLFFSCFSPLFCPKLRFSRWLDGHTITRPICSLLAKSLLLQHHLLPVPKSCAITLGQPWDLLWYKSDVLDIWAKSACALSVITHLLRPSLWSREGGCPFHVFWHELCLQEPST